MTTRRFFSPIAQPVLVMALFLNTTVAERAEEAEGGAGVPPARLDLIDARTGEPATLPAPQALDTRLAPWLATAATAEGAERIVDEILDHCRAHGRPVMEIAAEPFSPEEGVLRLQVFPGLISGMSLAGGSAWMREAVADDWARKIGRPLDMNAVEEWLDWTHRNPFHQATLSFTPGAEPATAEGLLTLHSERTFGFYTQWRNDGVEPLGQHRFAAGVETGDLFGWPVYIAAEVHADDSFSDSLGGRGLARWFLPWHHELRLSGGAARVDLDDLLPGYDLTSSLRTWDFSARYLWPLTAPDRPRPGGWKLEAGLGVDYRRTKSGVSLAGLTVEGTADTAHLAVELNAARRGRTNHTVLAWQGFYSPGHVTGRDTDAARSELRVGAEGDYVAGRLDLWSHQSLPGGWALDLRATGQWSEAPLLATEQLALAGSHAVRGYDEAAVLADSGAWARFEAHAPVWTTSIFARPFGAKALAFFDAGWGRDAVSHDTTTLAAAGLGLRVQWTTRASLALDYGWRLTEPGGRAHVALRVDF